MRTINATLKAALASGSIDLIARLKVYVGGVYYATLDILKFTLSGTELEVTAAGLIPSSNAPDEVKIILERGVRIAGYEYTLLSGKFTPRTGAASIADEAGILRTTVRAHLAPAKRITFAGDVSYQTAITSFCTAIGKTPVFKVPGAAYWAYQFLPAGRVYTSNNAAAFLTLLRQKYLLYACDNGGEQVLFYHALETPATDADLHPPLYRADVGTYQRRRFIARDENNTVRYGGNSADPLYNLGFVKSSENLPARYSQNQPVEFNLPVNLEYQCGDAFNVDDSNYYVYPAEVRESFDPQRSPCWTVAIRQLVYFSGTEGGALPSTIEAAAPYTPLNTSSFNHILSSDDNNLQAAMQTVDDHVHPGREILTGNRTYYVRTDGSDANTGLTNSAGGALLTIQKAIDTASALDTSIYDVLLQVADGTYVQSIIQLRNILGSGQVTIQGNNATPANVIIDGGFSKITPGTIYYIRDLKLIKNISTNVVALGISYSAFVNISNLIFGSGFGYHTYIAFMGYLGIVGDYQIIAGATYHYCSLSGGSIGAYKNVILTGSPAFTVFALSSLGGNITSYLNTFTGACTGKRYDSNMNATIQTYGGGVNYFPGNSAGTIATGGQYA